MTASPVVPTATARAGQRPLGLENVELMGGLWAERRSTNRDVTMPHGLRQLEAAGNLENFRAAAVGGGTYAGGSDDAGLTLPFLDSDVYKWLEAVGWELARPRDAAEGALDRRVVDQADRVIGLVEAAQRGDGYLDTYFQLTSPGRQFHDLQWGHELYCLGHLAQAAVAWGRGPGDDRLLTVARRAADRAEAELGPGRRELVDGHPQIEMALVELFRLTREERYLRFAGTLLERRGLGRLGDGRFGAAYWQDREPVRSARAPTGHSVRQLYLDCGAADYAVETDDGELLAAVERRWEAMVAGHVYLTGGLGARQRDEAFGDPFELPPDAAYAETCAAIASVMLAWRLLLATGRPRYADLIERTSLNAVLVGLALGGDSFFYSNRLHVRDGEREETGSGPTITRRQPWFACACCPPNLMRLLAWLPDLLATADEAGLELHQYATARIEGELESGPIVLETTTEYPWDGAVEVRVAEAPGTEWRLGLRIPAWARDATASVNGRPEPVGGAAGRMALTRAWRPGDRVRLTLPMPPRYTRADPRIDAVRGTLAVERGPLVYALEQVDLPAGTALDEVALDASHPPELAPDDARLPGLRLLEVSAALSEPAATVQGQDGWPYDAADALRPPAAGTAARVRMVPYFAWGNRAPGGMRVWLPVIGAGAQAYAVDGMLATSP